MESVYLFVCLSVCLSVSTSVCLSTALFARSFVSRKCAEAVVFFSQYLCTFGVAGKPGALKSFSKVYFFQWFWYVLKTKVCFGK